jgi:hypothetical protein
MSPSFWKAPEPTTVFSAIWFHWATVFPGGNTAAAGRTPPPARTPVKTAKHTNRALRARSEIRKDVPLMATLRNWLCDVYAPKVISPDRQPSSPGRENPTFPARISPNTQNVLFLPDRASSGSQKNQARGYE